MKHISLLLLSILIFSSCMAQSGNDIYLLIRGDDIGSSHASNVACIQSYKEGIMRSVEIMVPGPWFPEAVEMLKENQGLDVGVHLVLTSEWSNIKWRPLTWCPSLTDENGYFYPMIWQRDDFPKGTALHDAPWKIEEIEAELRAQIEMAKKHLPNISHAGCHMGCGSCAPEIEAVINKLLKEYDIDISPRKFGVEGLRLWDRTDTTAAQRIRVAVEKLKSLKPGKYLFIDHPGLDTPEMQAIGHPGYEEVARDRDAVTKVFTSPDVMEVIKQRGIKLISYADLERLDLD
ncbi:MAG TPA: polysaccharide deacetylase family protein [Cyclobacteriaceae bacterium]|nr:polysaccharide deacetylase family protein [Cyclobacteriaceae bacterium]